MQLAVQVVAVVALVVAVAAVLEVVLVVGELVDLVVAVRVLAVAAVLVVVELVLVASHLHTCLVAFAAPSPRLGLDIADRLFPCHRPPTSPNNPPVCLLASFGCRSRRFQRPFPFLIRKINAD